MTMASVRPSNALNFAKQIRYGSFRSLTLGLALAAVPTGAAAQSAPADADNSGDIIVTAQKRAENVQDIPIAISAFSADQLQDRNVDAVNQLQYLAPSLHFGRQDGQALISIRGIGTSVLTPGADAGVAVHLDGVYVSKTQAQDAVMFDLDRVEVLRGPQGTVNGRNATGGAINLISARPTDDFTGYANLTFGNYDAIKTSAAISGPLIGDKVLARIAFRTENRDGYTPNIASPNRDRLDEANQQSIRGSLLFRLGENTELLLSADFDRVDTNGYPPIVHRTANGSPVPGVPPGLLAVGRQIVADSPTFYRRKIWGATANLRVDLDPFTITAISGYRQLRDHVLMDVDGTNLPILNANMRVPQEQFSQELNFTSNSNGPFDWLVGFYYFHEKQDPDLRFPRPGVSSLRIGGNVKTESYAIYGQASYDITDALSVTAGARYSRDRKKGNEFLQIPEFGINLADTHNEAWGAFTPKISIDYKVSPDVLLYGTISRGFRSGGINVGAMQGYTFDPEFVWNYEVGLKSQFADNRIQANLAAFIYDYTNLQLFQIRNQVPTVENAAKAKIKGVELELVAKPFGGLRFDFSGSYLDAKFGEYVTIEAPFASEGALDRAGNRLPRAPEWKANIGLENSWDIGNANRLTLRAEYDWTDKVYFNEFNRPETSQPAFGLWNLRANYEIEDGKFRIGAYIQNLTNKFYLSQMNVGSAGTNFTIQEYAGPPRTYGVTFGAKF